MVLILIDREIHIFLDIDEGSFSFIVRIDFFFVYKVPANFAKYRCILKSESPFQFLNASSGSHTAIARASDPNRAARFVGPTL